MLLTVVHLVVSWVDCDPQMYQMNKSQCTVDLTMYYHKFKLMMNVQFMGSHFVSRHLLRDSGIQVHLRVCSDCKRSHPNPCTDKLKELRGRN